MKSLKLISILLTLSLIWGCYVKIPDMSNNDENKSSEFEIIIEDNKDTIKTETEIIADGVIFHIHPKNVVGKVTIKTNENKWPKKVMINFYSSYSDFLYIDNGDIYLKVEGHGALSKKNKIVWFRQLSENQKSLDEIPSSHPYWINVTYYENYTELSIPNNLLDNSIKSFNVAWATSM